MNEKAIETRIKEYITISPNSFVLKYHGNGVSTKGVPDLIGSWRGFPFAVEVKKPGGKPSKIQKAWLARFNAGGYVTGVVSSIEDFINLFDIS